MLQYIYHYIKDMEFSGVFDAIYNSNNDDYIYLKYFLFIKYSDLIYIEINGVGSIIIPFKELLKHRYLKMYYDISVMLIDNKHKIIEKISKDDRYKPQYNKQIYNEERNWFIDSAYFLKDLTTKKRVETGKYYHYYNINPNNLRNMCISKVKNITKFYKDLYNIYGYEQGIIFKDLIEHYTNLLLEYNINLIDKELEKISASQEDDKNFFNLLELYNKKGMNADIFHILYNNLISEKGRKKYTKYLIC